MKVIVFLLWCLYLCTVKLCAFISVRQNWSVLQLSEQKQIIKH